MALIKEPISEPKQLHFLQLSSFSFLTNANQINYLQNWFKNKFLPHVKIVKRFELLQLSDTFFHSFKHLKTRRKKFATVENVFYAKFQEKYQFCG